MHYIKLKTSSKLQIYVDYIYMTRKYWRVDCKSTDLAIYPGLTLALVDIHAAKNHSMNVDTNQCKQIKKQLSCSQWFLLCLPS